MIELAHGGGGRASAWLLAEVIRPALAEPELERRHDGAVLNLAGPLAFTTDGYVVRPLFFPGGDIGTLAVNGTVNDLAMCGARPRFLSLAMVIEEGLPLATLRRVLASIREAARAAGVRVVTGDTKVVERGKADGLFLTTGGVGQVLAPSPIGPRALQPGDALLLSGDIGRHGIAVLAAREELGFEPPIASDCAPLAEPVLALLAEGIALHCLRDLTRGGLASGATELAETAGLTLRLEEAAVPVRPEVRAACELLGLEPMQVANEGCFLAALPAAEAARALAVLRRFPACAQAALVGEVAAGPARVLCRGMLGVERVLDLPYGEALPRIC